MRQHFVQLIVRIGTALICLLSAQSVYAAIADARLVGLAMHQEIGRNIYVGAIHYDELVPRPDDLVAADGPKVMEYRVIARRTSIRSLVGNILLQGELATGNPPSASTMEFAGNIMAAVKGSLYAGDSLEIVLDKNNVTIAKLDGHELTRIDSREVSDYLLMGWVGEGGPSTAFRSSILAADIDSSLLSIYSATLVSDERLATIATWAGPLLNEPEPLSLPETQDKLQIVDSSSSVASKPEPQQKLVVAVQTAEKPAASVTAQKKNPEPVQLASLTPTQGVIQSEAVETSAVDLIDPMEYSRRLATFNTNVLRSVYAKIRYPRVAVRRNLQGTLELDISVDKDGKLMEVVIAQSSGHSVLDKSAVRAAKDALSDTPLKNLDPVAITEYADDGGTLTIPIPVSFILTE